MPWVYNKDTNKAKRKKGRINMMLEKDKNYTREELLNNPPKKEHLTHRNSLGFNKHPSCEKPCDLDAISFQSSKDSHFKAKV